MVKEDIFCLERCRDAQGVCQIEEWVPALPNQKVFSDWRDPICRFGFDCHWQAAKTARQRGDLAPILATL
jgi:hypothetical protein